MTGISSNVNELLMDRNNDALISLDEDDDEDDGDIDENINTSGPKDLIDSFKGADRARPVAVGEALLHGMNGMAAAVAKLAEAKMESKKAAPAANEAMITRFEQIVGQQNDRIEKAFAQQAEINSALLEALKTWKQ